MSTKTIRVTVSPEGDVKIETSGFKGEECMEVTKDLKAALGDEGLVYSKDERFEVSNAHEDNKIQY